MNIRCKGKTYHQIWVKISWAKLEWTLYTVASYSNESFSLKWEWPILHPTSLCGTSFLVEGKRQAGSSHLNEKILIWIGHYSMRLCAITFKIQLHEWENLNQITCSLASASALSLSIFLELRRLRVFLKNPESPSPPPDPELGFLSLPLSMRERRQLTRFWWSLWRSSLVTCTFKLRRLEVNIWCLFFFVRLNK